MNEKLQEIIDFFEQAEGWSKDEIIADYIAEIEDQGSIIFSGL